MAKKKKQLQDEQMPVSVLWGNILMLSVAGTVDSEKAQRMMDVMLNAIGRTRSKTFILDIGAVAAIDTAVANHLIKITKATKLMGCTCVLSGVTPVIAQTIVHLGISLGDIRTEATLRDALETAFEMIGLEVRKKES